MLGSFFAKLESIKTPAHAAAMLIFSTGVVRYFAESLVSGSMYSRPLEILDTFVFYIPVFLYFLAGQKFFLGYLSYTPILFGFLIAFFPPIIDFLLRSDPVYFYPEINLLLLSEQMSPGEVIAIYSAILVFATYISMRKNNVVFFLPAAIFAWGIAQLFASVHPHILSATVADLVYDFDLLSRSTTILWLIAHFSTRLLLVLAALSYLDADFLKFVFYRSSRIFLFAALSLFAISIFRTPFIETLAIFTSAFLMYLLVFVLNTRGDEREDRVNKRPSFQINLLTPIVLLLFFGVSLVTLYTMNILAMYSLLFAFVFPMLYNAPFKLKRFFPLSYMIEGAGFSLLFISYALGDLQLSAGLAWKFALCFSIFAIGSIVKDYKDIPGDKAAGVQTIFTILDKKSSEKFWLFFRIALIIGAIFFVIFEKGALSALSMAVSLMFAASAAYLLFFGKFTKEQIVDGYISLFAALLLVSSFT